MRRPVIALFTATALTGAMVSGVAAQEVEDVALTVVGTWSGLPLHKQFEQPFWTETLPAASGGKITVNLTTFDQMGVSGGDVYRLLDQGVFDVGMTVADYTVADAPELEGLDVPLVATDAASARAMVDAARPMVEDIMRDRFGSKLLGIAPYPPQIVFCNHEIAGLKDLEGLKVRGSGRMTTEFLEALGAEGVNLAFSEVPGALERGVIDCAITGSGSGYSAGWWESSTHLMTLPLGGWDAVVAAMNLEKWASLNEATQALIQTQVVEGLETPAWDAAAGALEADIACLTGNGDCPAGEPADMVLVEPTEEDTETANRVLREVVLPDWAARAGSVWAERWSSTVGAAVGVQID